MDLSAWRSGGRRFDYRGHSIFFRDDVDAHAPPGARTLLCLHGFPTASFDFHKLWPELTKRFRVVALDMIGYGFSAKPRSYEYSIADQASLYEALLAHLSIERVTVLAHDVGDTVLQELLARTNRGAMRATIERACMLNGGLFPETYRPRLIQKLLLSPVGPLVARLSTEGSFRKSFRAIFGPDTQPSDQELRDAWALVEHDKGAHIFHKLLRYMQERARNRERWVSALVDTKVPLRLVNGALDPVSGAHVATRYRELVPKPDVVLLERVGHYPQMEAPKEVLDALLAFAG